MARPTIKQELVVEHISNGLCHIWAATPDATSWIETEAPLFGRLFNPGDKDDHYTLFITPCFDYEEVAAYLAKMQD